MKRAKKKLTLHKNLLHLLVFEPALHLLIELMVIS